MTIAANRSCNSSKRWFSRTSKFQHLNEPRFFLFYLHLTFSRSQETLGSVLRGWALSEQHMTWVSLEPREQRIKAAGANDAWAQSTPSAQGRAASWLERAWGSCWSILSEHCDITSRDAMAEGNLANSKSCLTIVATQEDAGLILGDDTCRWSWCPALGQEPLTTCT